MNVASTSFESYLGITNNGTETVTFPGFTLTGVNPGDFAISTNRCETTLASGALATFS